MTENNVFNFPARKFCDPLTEVLRNGARSSGARPSRRRLPHSQGAMPTS